MKYAEHCFETSKGQNLEVFLFKMVRQGSCNVQNLITYLEDFSMPLIGSKKSVLWLYEKSIDINGEILRIDVKIADT